MAWHSCIDLVTTAIKPYLMSRQLQAAPTAILVTDNSRENLANIGDACLFTGYYRIASTPPLLHSCIVCIVPWLVYMSE